MDQVEEMRDLTTGNIAWKYLGKKNYLQRFPTLQDGTHRAGLLIEITSAIGLVEKMAKHHNAMRVFENCLRDISGLMVTLSQYDSWREDIGKVEQVRGSLVALIGATIHAIESLDLEVYVGRDLYDLENLSVPDMPGCEAPDDPA